MANEKFCLKWNDFESNISVAFRDLRDEKELFDITLACEDSQIQAHRVILSACSPFFRTVLKNNPHQHPLIYLRGMRYTDLESVLNFMYHGEVNVAQDELNSFLSVAEDLRVKGLTQNKNGESTPVKRPKSPVSKSRPPDRDSVPPAKRARPSPAPVAQDDDIQEVVPVKSEPRDIVPVVTQPPATYHSQAVVQQDEYIENYDEYEQYDDQYMEGQQQETDKGMIGNKDDLAQFMTRGEDRTYSCTFCGFSNKNKTKVTYHLEGVHFKGFFNLECSICHKICPGRNSLSTHMSRVHSNSLQP